MLMYTECQCEYLLNVTKHLVSALNSHSPIIQFQLSSMFRINSNIRQSFTSLKYPTHRSLEAKVFLYSDMNENRYKEGATSIHPY
jgi:hypothetical protein